jgi:transcriptional regulator with XRE-family HTH domain
MSRNVLVSTKASQLRQLLRMAIGQEEIGRRIAQAREEAGLSQRELAEKIGVADAQSVSRYERGITEVKTKRIEKIAEATGKPLSFFIQLMDEDEEPEPASPEEIQVLHDAVLALQQDVDEILRLLRAEREAEPEAS